MAKKTMPKKQPDAKLAKAAKDLRKIQSQMQGLLARADAIVSKHGTGNVAARASGYWINSIEQMLDCGGGYETDMEQTIQEILAMAWGEDPETVGE